MIDINKDLTCLQIHRVLPIEEIGLVVNRSVKLEVTFTNIRISPTFDINNGERKSCKKNREVNEYLSFIVFTLIQIFLVNYQPLNLSCYKLMTVGKRPYAVPDFGDSEPNNITFRTTSFTGPKGRQHTCRHSHTDTISR